MKTLTMKRKPNEALVETGREVIDLACAALFVDMRFLDTALFRLTFKPDDEDAIPTWYTNGSTALYNVRHLLRRYRLRQSTASHDILHVALHCVFRHMFVSEQVDQRLWDLACDIAVEALIGSLGFESVRDGREPLRAGVLEEVCGVGGTVTAERVYRSLCVRVYDEEDLAFMERSFYVDEHLWYVFDEQQGDEGEPDGEGDGDDGEQAAEGDDGEGVLGGEGLSEEQREELERAWEEASKSIQTGLETIYGQQQVGEHSGDLLQALRSVNRTRYDYKSFLHSFSTWGETMQVNPDEFDTVFYTYGLELYGDMPLIEPLEHREVKRLRDVAIVIDTSGSVSGELLQTLFERTYDLIMGENNAFKRFCIHLIQCDAEVKDDVVLHNREELERALADFTFKGQGGTNYVPAFEYVDELVAQGAFTNFRGVLYFTDGYGRFPTWMPAYQCAFVFIDDEYDEREVPPWAIKLVLTTDEVRML